MTQETQTVSRKIVKKITAKVVSGGIDILKLAKFIDLPGNNDGSVMPLFNIIGQASDFTTGQSDYGPYVKLLGVFKAVNIDTGEEFRSGACMLPGSGNDMVYGALRGLGEQGGAVEFAFRVGVKRDKSAGVGYAYDVEQVVVAGQADPLAALEKSLMPPKLAAVTDQSAGSAPAAVEEKQTGTGSKKR